MRPKLVLQATPHTQIQHDFIRSDQLGNENPTILDPTFGLPWITPLATLPRQNIISALYPQLGAQVQEFGSAFDITCKLRAQFEYKYHGVELRPKYMNQMFGYKFQPFLPNQHFFVLGKVGGGKVQYRGISTDTETLYNQKRHEVAQGFDVSASTLETLGFVGGLFGAFGLAFLGICNSRSR